MTTRRYRARRDISILLATLAVVVAIIAGIIAISNRTIMLSCTAGDAHQSITVSRISLANIGGGSAPTYAKIVTDPVKVCRQQLGYSIEASAVNAEIRSLQNSGHNCGTVTDTRTNTNWYYQGSAASSYAVEGTPPTPLPTTCPHTSMRSPDINTLTGVACTSAVGSPTVTLSATRPPTCTQQHLRAWK